MSTNISAEWSVVAALMKKPERIGEAIGTQLEPDDFADAACKAVFTTIQELYFTSTSVDPLIVGELTKATLASIWMIPVEQAAPELFNRVRGAEAFSDNMLDHANLVRKLSTTRQLASIAADILAGCADGKLSPQELGDRMSSEALRIVAGTAKRSELMDWMDLGRVYAKKLQHMRVLRKSGKRYGVYTGMPWIDEWTKGIAPGELCFLAGDPGAGKSAIAWEAAKGFAKIEMQKNIQDPVNTLLLSMEMGEVPTGQRFVQGLTHIDGMRLREGDITDEEYRRILQEWKALEGLPIRFNFAANFRLSQMRALITEGIRNHNVGFIIIDHFRMLDPDKPVENGVREDEVKVRFLKEQVAKELDVAVLCLAHTIKVGRGVEGGSRPKLSDLRGSGQISAAADMVGFLHRPYRSAGEHERLETDVAETDAELVWAKNRFGTESVAPFSFDPARMRVWPRDA